MQRIVLAANAEADQPWVADAAAQLAKETGAQVAVVSVDELEAQGVIAGSKTVRSGRALEQIMAFAEEQNADLIVVGSSTRGRVASALLGSVPLGLVGRSRRPVLVVTEPRQAE